MKTYIVLDESGAMHLKKERYFLYNKKTISKYSVKGLIEVPTEQ